MKRKTLKVKQLIRKLNKPEHLEKIVSIYFETDNECFEEYVEDITFDNDNVWIEA